MTDLCYKSVEGLKFNDEKAGGFTGYGSVFGVLDKQNEVVMPGAFRTTLNDWVRKGHVFLNHDPNVSVATVDRAYEDNYGLKFEATFLNNRNGQDARTMLIDRQKRGKAPSGLSIGYRPLRTTRRKDGATELNEIALKEVSLLNVDPANDAAQVIAVKSYGGSMTEWQALQQKARIRNAIEAAGATWSGIVLNSAKFKESKMGGQKQSIDVPNIKAAGDPISSTALTFTSFAPMTTGHALKPSGVLDLIARRPTPTEFLQYSIVTSPLTNAAAFIAEGAAKPETQPRWSAATCKCEEVATYANVTRQALDSVEGLERTLNVDLQNMLEERIADRVINGTGVTPDILGILATPNIITVAFVTGATILESLYGGINAIQAPGYGIVNGIVLNPTDALALANLKTTAGAYAVAPQLPTVVTDAHVPVGTAIVADWRYATLYERGTVRIQTGYVNDNILRNIFTFAASERVGLAISRPQAFAKVALA